MGEVDKSCGDMGWLLRDDQGEARFAHSPEGPAAGDHNLW